MDKKREKKHEQQKQRSFTMFGWKMSDALERV